jgi:hypothetical protein
MKQLKEASSSLPANESVQADGLLHDVIVQTPQRPARADGIAVGTFDGIDADGIALVSIATFGLSRIRARSISQLDPANIGQPLALGFEGGDPMQPIILGLMLAAPASPTAPPTDVLLDGERVVLTAEHEIELRCGEAALILSADGRIQLRGTYITSHASATQRILGGSVNIN